MSVEKFFMKRADLSTILPDVAGPAIGGFAGRMIGSHFNAPDLGGMLGVITGGTAGKLLREKVEGPKMPIGAPYALDATAADIPAWALQGAQLLKQSGHFGDIVGGDLGGLAWPVAEGIRGKQAPRQIAKNVAGQGLGTLAGGAAGHLAGGLIDKVVGHHVGGPFGVPLSTLLAGLGATIGNVKGLEFTRGQGA